MRRRKSRGPCTPEAQESGRVGLDPEGVGKPGCKSRRQLRIDPGDQATSTGWSNRWLANRRQAWTSSSSRSGKSSITCWGDNPFASRSRTSVTRIRSPRMHGRPPHCSGSTVIRSARYVTSFSSGPCSGEPQIGYYGLYSRNRPLSTCISKDYHDNVQAHYRVPNNDP